ncbi:NAD(P)-binding protein [Schizophyllum commune H4-8]|uniref:NAD(P)-binding protein n=1 Tax=Schizophyllum commune (strain H4-8 / FGSC 9210) TaxID=578458 RepID=UPI00215E1C7C|nr:NAD(P)-binding protein [Schizophyllum commune H4-8]KAI5892204.1 NAD(P)-binding protein [Schizophyllum commune H4-8]
MSFSVADRVILVTGGGTGIGAWATEAFVKGGAKVYITGRREAKLNEVVEKMDRIAQGKTIPFPCDLGKESEIDKLVDFIKSKEERLDVLVNNAGPFYVDTVDDEHDPTKGMDQKCPFPLALSPAEAWKEQFAVTTWAPYTLTLKLIPLLAAAAKLGDGRGSVIQISSIAAKFWNPYWSIPAYQASKAGQEHTSNILAAKLYTFGIRVNTVSPGSYDTDANPSFHEAAMSHPSNNERIPLGRSGGADDIVGPILFFASAASKYITGQRLDVDGGVMLVANGTNKIAPYASKMESTLKP